MKFPWASHFDETNGTMLEHRYGNREQLGETWIEKRKLSDKNEKREDGKPNPHHPRFVVEEKIARLEFDMAFLVESNRILVEQQEMLTAIFQRMAVLEGAYSHIMTAIQVSNLDYTAKLRQHVQDAKGKNSIETTQPKENNDEKC